MNDILFYLILIPVGFLAGFCSGSLGVGGGVIYVPVLQLLLHMSGFDYDESIFISIGTSLFAGTFASAGAAFNHYRADNIDLKYAALFSCGSVVSAIILPNYIVHWNPEILKIIFISILVFTVIRMFSLDKVLKIKRIKYSSLLLPIFGGIIAALSVSTGLGGGVLIVPLLFYLFSLDIKKAIGTSSVIIFITMFSSSIIYSSINVSHLSNNIVLHKVGLVLGLCAIVGSIFGVKFVMKKSPEFVKSIFLTFLIIVIVISILSIAT